MKVVIVEDELLTAEYLADMLLKLPDEIAVAKILSSIGEAIEYLKYNRSFDLMFCDIQLGDGHSFEIFRQLQLDVPVVFCTAFDKYALEAFKNNGIDYILKPFTEKDIKACIEKYKTFRHIFAGTAKDYTSILKILETGYNQDKKASSLLINFKGKIIPVKIGDIAIFSIHHKMTQLISFDNQKYITNHTLEELEIICGPDFYRANRQFLVNRQIIQEVLQYFARKLVVKLKIDYNEEIIISKNKVPDFLAWLKT